MNNYGVVKVHITGKFLGVKKNNRRFARGKLPTSHSDSKYILWKMGGVRGDKRRSIIGFRQFHQCFLFRISWENFRHFK